MNPRRPDRTRTLSTPTVRIVPLDADKREGQRGTTRLTFTVTRDSATGTAAVDYAVTTATASTVTNGDFAGTTTGTVSFAAGQTSRTVTIQVAPDLVPEQDEPFQVVLSHPRNLALDADSPSATGTIRNDDRTTRSSQAILRGQGDGQAGIIRVLADFAKAAYHVQSWENRRINDVSPYANTAYGELIAQGWEPLGLNIAYPSSSTSPFPATTSTIDDQSCAGQMRGGFYTLGNAAALVARCGEAVVLAFRGTNDNGEDNPEDADNDFYPDRDHWTDMDEHYEQFAPLIASLDRYIASQGIRRVYVTGHSLGGAMAIQYMGTHPGSLYTAVTFAAPGYTTNPLTGFVSYADRSRVTHIEINGDIVPDIGRHGGRTLHFEGHETSDDMPVSYSANNHSMDYYRQITRSIDPASWTRILAASGNPQVYLGASRVDMDFIVDGRRSGINSLENRLGNDTLNPSDDYDILYGGVGDDRLTGGSGDELLLAGEGQDGVEGQDGNDRLFGDQGSDTLTGGAGADTFYFTAMADLGDAITDFNPDQGDRLAFSRASFGQLAPGPVAPDSFSNAGSATRPNHRFVFNPTDHTLAYDPDGNGPALAVTIATLRDVSRLTSSSLVMAAQ